MHDGRKVIIAFTCMLLLARVTGFCAEPAKPKRKGRIQVEPVEQKSQATLPAELPPNPTVYLLRDPAIHTELKLTAEQKKSALEISALANEPLWRLRDTSAETGPAVDFWKQLKAKLSERTSQILTPVQRTRLAQIVLQLKGTEALSDPAVAQALELTPEQRQKIAKLRENYDTELKELRVQAGTGKDLVELNRRAKKLQTQLTQGLTGSLTTAQKTTWSNLVGRPFDSSRLLPLSAQAPEFRDVNAWLNGGPVTFADLKGRVVILHFYTFGCINCIHNFPSYKTWQDQFEKKKVTIVGIHTPETPGEKELESVRKKAAENGFRFPIAVDNDLKNWQAWGNTIWPAVYVVDQRGFIRYWWYGELNWQGAGGEKYIAGKVNELLAEK